jgi:hypothetical protein
MTFHLESQIGACPCQRFQLRPTGISSLLKWRRAASELMYYISPTRIKEFLGRRDISFTPSSKSKITQPTCMMFFALCPSLMTMRTVKSFSMDNVVRVQCTQNPFDPQKHRTRCCITASGDVCLAPANARSGDIIAIFLGSKHPFVLRFINPEPLGKDVSDTTIRTTVIGPCIVPQAMFGKLVKEARERSIAPIDFTLV